MVLSMQKWLGKVAVVTGANSGIGEAIAQKLAEEGIIVVGLDKRIEKIEENSKTLANSKRKLFGVKTNVSQEEEILYAFDWIKKNVGLVSIIINCAGTFYHSSMLEGKTENWKETLQVNLLGLCITCREAIKIMRENNIDGHIINVCSIAGHEPVVPNLNMYSASKFGVRAVTETIRLELNAVKSKIKIGCISPGGVDTPMLRATLKVSEGSDVMKNYLQIEDIVDAIIYILSTPPHVQIQDLKITEMSFNHKLI